nr:hypothetical protein [Tanacetum cinerariifolium]
MQTQTSNTLHNAIMEAGSKDLPPMLTPGNYVQWKSRIKRYIDTKPNHELIHYCLTNPPYELGWKEKFVLDSEGNPTTTTEKVFETYKNVTQDIRDQLNTEAKTVQIILTGIDNDIYSTVDACPNACEMWKAIKRGAGYDNQRLGNVAGARETVGTKVVQKYGIQCYNCKEFGHVAKECQKLKRAKDAAYHKEKMLLCKQEEAGIQFNVSNDDHYNVFAIESEHTKQSKSVHDTYPIEQNEHNVIIDSLDMSYDKEQIDQNEDDDLANERNVAGDRETVGSSMVQKYGIQCYNCKEYRHVSRECQKPKREKDAAYHREKMLLCMQEEAGIQLNAEQADCKDDTDDESDDQELEAHYMYMAKLQQVSPDAVDSGPIFDKEPEQKIDQNDEDADLAKERGLLASLIEKLKCEIDETKNRNTILETSNKVLVEKLKKLKRRDSIEYASEMELECAK